MTLVGGSPWSREVLTRALAADRTRLPVLGGGDRKSLGQRDHVTSVRRWGGGGKQARMESGAAFAVLGIIVRKGRIPRSCHSLEEQPSPREQPV